MFGYIRPFKPQLRICEFDTYKAVYCGLCRQLGESYGLLARFTLSYDFAFLSILSMALSDEAPAFCKQRCIAHPLQKKSRCLPDDSSHFSACMAMILLYHKVEDNYRDSGLGGKLFAQLVRPFAARARKQAALEYPALDDIVAHTIAQQAELEAANCTDIDKAAEPSAQSLALIFKELGTADAECRVLYRLGYLLGRWVYLMDALDDLDDDVKHCGYNPLALTYSLTTLADDQTMAREAAHGILNQTAAEITSTFDLLTLKRYQTILENVIYLGLKNSLNLVEAKRSNAHDRSL